MRRQHRQHGNAAMFDADDMAEAFAAQLQKRAADFADLWPLSGGL